MEYTVSNQLHGNLVLKMFVSMSHTLIFLQIKKGDTV